MYVIDVVVVVNDVDCEQGLMYCLQFVLNEGMLFVFNENVVYCFWMKNMLILLLIVFICVDGMIIDIDEMCVEIIDNYCLCNNGVYVFEMSKGWFVVKGIKFGMKFDGLLWVQ